MDIVSGSLSEKRTYISTDAQEKCLQFDPRFLMFEFSDRKLLRPGQVTLVKEFVQSAVDGVSLVKQMIMGAGKTAVISPLLTLMLADGKRLVTLVVPGPLLKSAYKVNLLLKYSGE